MRFPTSRASAVCVVLSTLFSALGIAQETKPAVRDSVVPIYKGSAEENALAQAYSFVADPKLPNVLLLGDSISVGYTLAVRQQLRGVANVYRPMRANGLPENCGGTRIWLAENLERWLKAQPRWDVIHFNTGLHDGMRLDPSKPPAQRVVVATPEAPPTVSLEEYTRHLQRIVTRLQATGARLVFATTTPTTPTCIPVDKPEDIIAYNAAALSVMSQCGVAVDDLYTQMRPRQSELQFPNNVHFKSEGSQVLGNWVAQAIRPFLEHKVSAAPTFHPTADGDMKTILQRMRDDLLSVTVDNEAVLVQKALASLRGDGSWPEIDYADQATAKWQPNEHLIRLELMAKAAAREPNAELNKAVDLAYDFWVAKDFRNRNWWHNSIGVPTRIGHILLLIRENLSHQRLAGGLQIMKRAKLGGTGQNLLWVASCQTVWACIEQDAPHLTEAVAAAAGVMQVMTKEGIQADFSFHQHGKVLYSGGYGAAFANDATKLAWLLDGTEFALPASAQEVVLHYLLDGLRWTLRGPTLDYSTVGREISRKSVDLSRVKPAYAYASRLSKLTDFQRSALKETLDRINAGTHPQAAPPLEGNRHFWRSDYHVHQRAGWMITLHMVSKRTQGTDAAYNFEGMRSHALADGGMFLYRRGDEYQDIFGVWNWLRVPGTTEVDDPALFKSPVQAFGTTEFVGGVSDGRYGACAMNYFNKPSGARAHKAWFMFDDQAICLGAGLQSPAKGHLITSLNQCLLKGPVTLDSAPSTALPPGERTLSDPRWVLHDGIGYVFHEPGAVHLANTKQVGAWYGINRSYPMQTEQQDVLSLWLDHGVGLTDGHYAYTLMPCADPDRLARYIAHPTAVILANTTELQAVWHSSVSMLQAAFWSAGEVRPDKQMTVSVDHPCILLAQRTSGGIHLAVSDPTQSLSKVRVSVTGHFRGDHCTWDSVHKRTEILVDFPINAEAGRSVLQELLKVE